MKIFFYTIMGCMLAVTIMLFVSYYMASSECARNGGHQVVEGTQTICDYK